MKVIVAAPSVDIEPGSFVLTHSNWNDWWEFETLYTVTFHQWGGGSVSIGSLKIGWTGENEGKAPRLPGEFANLSSEFFSLGQDESFYTNLTNLDGGAGQWFLRAVNDVVMRPDLYSKHAESKVMEKSLMRFVSESSVKGQFTRIVAGHSRLAKFNVRYIERKTEEQAEEVVFPFVVSPDDVPPSNIHVLVGRNGSGKTRLLRRMAASLISGDPWSDTAFEDVGGNSAKTVLSGVGMVSFSAFDRHPPLRNNVPGLNVFEVGLKKLIRLPRANPGEKSKSKVAIKTYMDIENDMGEALYICSSRSLARWERAVETLESDPEFQRLDVHRLAQGISSEGMSSEANRLFRAMSSGHQIVLLTITQLVARLEERTLVLFDEPEGHLHPPLLSALIRAISGVLNEVNAFAIVATHSPVILQEVPASCVRYVLRTEDGLRVRMPTVESFGENAGVLTREVFGLEVNASGFHRLLTDLLIDHDFDVSKVLDRFDGSLGSEALALLVASQRENASKSSRED